MKLNAYQLKPKPLRWALWVRYRVTAFAVGCSRVAWWYATGAKMTDDLRSIGSRWTNAKCAVRCELSMADYRMGNWHYLTDILDDLQGRA